MEGVRYFFEQSVWDGLPQRHSVALFVAAAVLHRRSTAMYIFFTGFALRSDGHQRPPMHSIDKVAARCRRAAFSPLHNGHALPAAFSCEIGRAAAIRSRIPIRA